MAPHDDQTSGRSADAAEEWDQFGEAYDHPPFHGRARTYVIASTPRSGSHLLGHLLHATGQLGSPLEYFHPKHLATWQDKLGEPTPAGALHALMERRTSPTGWFGVKAHWPQFATIKDDDAVLDVLDIRAWIRIGRSDRVAQAVSLAIARQTNAWISFHQATREPEYDFGSVARAVADLEQQEAAWDDYLVGRGVAPVVVAYEDLLADQDQVVADVCRSLGVEPPSTAPSARTARQANALNEEWRERYLADLGRQPG